MPDTEKITINLSAVDLGRIDLLSNEGFYSNRTDFIRTAIRKELDAQRDVLEKSVSRHAAAIGYVVYSRESLERLKKKRQKVDLSVVGCLQLTRDIPPELAVSTIQSLKVHGVLRASQAVKDALADRIL